MPPPKPPHPNFQSSPKPRPERRAITTDVVGRVPNVQHEDVRRDERDRESVELRRLGRTRAEKQVLPSSVPPPERTTFHVEPLQSLIPASFDPLAESPELERAVRRRGAVLGKPPASVYEQTKYVEPPWWRSAKGIAGVTVAFTGFLAGLTASIVAIVVALRGPAPPAPDADLKTKVEALDAAKVLEAQAVEARALKQQAENDALKSQLKALDQRFPSVTPDPNRKPADSN